MPHLRLPSRYQIRMWLLSLGMFALALGLLGSIGWGARVLWRQTHSPASVTSMTSVTSATSGTATSDSAANRPTGVDTGLVINDPVLDQVMLAAINADRQANGLVPVAWDATAAAAGAAHASEMAALGFFSHWSPDGFGPEMRYARAGGTDNAMENIFTSSSRYSDGRPAPIESFADLVVQAERDLMQSPGHRRNILMPSHTHVGMGFAYNPQTGSFYLVQEFVDRYVVMQPLPQTAPVGALMTVAGQLLPGSDAPLINATYAPFPQPMSLDELNATGTYLRAAQIYAPVSPQVAGDGSFSASVPLDYAGRPGSYSVRVWVTVGGEQVPASEQLIEVR